MPNQRSGDSGTDQPETNATTDSDDSGDGDSVGFAAAIGVNIASVEARSTIAGNATSDTGSISVRSLSQVDGTAKGDGSAVDGPLTTAVGIGVGINVVEAPRTAEIAGDATAATSLTVEAVMHDRALVFNPGAVDTDAETIDLGAPHGLRTGDAVVYENGGGTDIVNLTHETTYYAIVVDATTVKLAETAELAAAGTAINLDSAGIGDGHRLVDGTQATVAEARSGASATDTGVAGSFALNYASMDSYAGLRAGSSATAGTGAGDDVTIRSVNITSATALAAARSELTPEEGDATGVGAAIALNIVSADSRADIADGVGLTGGDNLLLSASGSHLLSTVAKGGASGGGTSVGGAVAIAYSDSDTVARLGSSATGVDVTGSVTLSATHTGSSSVEADAESAGASAAVGVAIALNMLFDSAVAETARVVTGDGAIRLRLRRVRLRTARRLVLPRLILARTRLILARRMVWIRATRLCTARATRGTMRSAVSRTARPIM
jgi:hypothetical protein